MAVAPTGAIYKALEFDGVSSRTYGVYITGAAVYNAPERDVEMIAIPGRNGSFALDKGRFENIEVTYPAGIFADAESDFAEAVSDFRNFLCSRNGYVRLQDEYNPNEYRMAVYKSGLEVDPALLRAGEFEIVFECKPQRFLKIGETAIDVTSGDTITNPTLFEASPLLKTVGYGDIHINDEVISLSQRDDVAIPLFNTKEWDGPNYNLAQNVDFDDSLLIGGDRIYSDNSGDAICTFSIKWDFDPNDIIGISATNMGYAHWIRGSSYGVDFYKSEVEFVKGIAQTFTGTSTFNFTSIAYGTLTGSISLSLDYDGNHTFTISASYITPPHMQDKPGEYRHLQINKMYADAVYQDVYIDLDIGEAYTELLGKLYPYNNKVAFSSKLPTLKPGTNTITFDNTITLLKIFPRWWKI